MNPCKCGGKYFWVELKSITRYVFNVERLTYRVDETLDRLEPATADNSMLCCDCGELAPRRKSRFDESTVDNSEDMTATGWGPFAPREELLSGSECPVVPPTAPVGIHPGGGEND